MTSESSSPVAAHDSFAPRHIGPDATDVVKMAQAVGFEGPQALVSRALPKAIALSEGLDLASALTEAETLARLRELAGKNTVRRPMIGMGYYGTFTPSVIKRNLFENPSWYTAYTPYQPEISQGRLEALLNFQTMVAELAGLELAGASLLDEGTAAAEAMTLLRRVVRKKPQDAPFVVDAEVLPQTMAVLRTRAEALDIPLQVADLSAGLPEGDFYGVLVQYPGVSGEVRDLSELIAAAHERDAQVCVAADLLACALLKSPGEMGADVVVGSAQRFGVPLGFGGPHAGFMAVRDGLQRSLPGRLVGVSQDADGKPGYRLALQTREQHIRREKATSNICTAQVLLAVMASMYAVYHGPEGLRAIAGRCHEQAVKIAASLQAAGFEVASGSFFDTVTVTVPGRAEDVTRAAEEGGYLIRCVDADTVSLACDETTSDADVAAVVGVFGASVVADATDSLPQDLLRTSSYLTHPVFSRYHSETSMMRYLKRLADDDFALDRGMIPLGSCTMKLNAATEMEAVSWPEFAALHPFAPEGDTVGSRELAAELEALLAELTGYHAVSLQPNAGSQGELAGLLAIRAYHRSRGDEQRRICLIPTSAHGTNAASAVMAGLKVVTVGTDAGGNVDMDDLAAKIEKHGPELAAIMVTYPSTHGVFEEGITTLCEMVHAAGGQVYVDGANLNALVGLAKPGTFGSDVSHLNLHKTFCIPHGGGGPGVGPVAVAEHLAPFLPSATPMVTSNTAMGHDAPVGPVSAAPFGSAGILPISWAYITMMGARGLTDATHAAVVAANYVARRLAEHYPILYTGNDGLVAHECILDLRPLTKETGVTVDDVAKRLIDFGFHAPTMSFPVAGTLMVEPTESESLGELDRFCDAMIAIREEADKVAQGVWPADDNPLCNAPHTAECLVQDWDHPYTREEAVYPGSTSRRGKYWPPVRRIDGAYGDRHLVCSCPPMEDLADG